MRPTAILFFHEMRILLRDRQALALLFAMPLALIVFLTLALQDVYQSKIGKKISLTVVSTQSCTEDVCTKLVAELRHFGYTVRVDNVLNGKDELSLVMPKDIEVTISLLRKAKRLAEAEQIQLIFDPTLDHSLRSLVQGHLLLSLQAVLMDRVQKEMDGVAKKRGAPASALPNVSRYEGLVHERAQGGVILPNPIEQTVPAWALFGMFFIVIPMSNSMIRDRRLGVFKRLLSFPVSRTQLLVGKVLPFFLINIMQFMLMFAVGVFVLPRLTHLNLVLDYNFPAVFVVTLASALAATGYGLVVSCLAKTPEQASASGALSVVILAIVGGVMIPRFVMPEFMQDLARISPLYWGLEAYQDVLVRKLGIAAVTGKLAILTSFSLLCGWVSKLYFHWNEA